VESRNRAPELQLIIARQAWGTSRCTDQRTAPRSPPQPLPWPRRNQGRDPFRARQLAPSSTTDRRPRHREARHGQWAGAGSGAVTAPAPTTQPSAPRRPASRRTWTQEGSRGMVGRCCGCQPPLYEGSAIGPSKRATGTVDDPFGTAEPTTHVLRSLRQQQLPGADPLQASRRVLNSRSGCRARGLNP